MKIGKICCLLNVKGAKEIWYINEYEIWLINEFSLNFLELFIIGKYVKIKFQNWGLSYYFFSSRDQKVKNITKFETEFLKVELNKRTKAATSGYSTVGNFLQCIYSTLVAKNHQKFWSRCLVHEFSFTDIF